MPEGGALPQEKARELALKALETPERGEKIRLAEEALALDASCADAYLALAEEAADPEEALALHERALAAAEAALPPGALEEAGGDFQDLAQAETYLSARTGLAFVLGALGRDEEAIGHLEEVLRLDPDDTAGVTHPLLAWLVDRNQDERARDLLESRPCECAQWEYTRALLAYRAEGGEDDDRARWALEYALETDYAVPDYLLGKKPLPEAPPTEATMLLDDEAEAGAYAATALRAWATTPGALRWLAEHARSGYARLLVHRQPAQEDVPDAAFLSALEALLHARALELELETHRTVVPGLVSLFAVSGEEDAIRALVHLLAEGGALTNALVVEVEDEEAAGPFRELGVKTVLDTDELPD